MVSSECLALLPRNPVFYFSFSSVSLFFISSWISLLFLGITDIESNFIFFVVFFFPSFVPVSLGSHFHFLSSSVDFRQSTISELKTSCLFLCKGHLLFAISFLQLLFITSSPWFPPQLPLSSSFSFNSFISSRYPSLSTILQCQ